MCSNNLTSDLSRVLPPRLVRPPPRLQARTICKMYLSIVLVVGSVAGPRWSGHQTPFNLYQDLLCIKLVGFCVDQEERGSVRRHHPLGLGEALHYQRVHARHLREYRPGHRYN